jgi:MinD superfamily P-loop ATPase
MTIAVLSGKGGTGKTFVSTNLAASICNSTYLDCDIEEPNGYLFLKPKVNESWNVSVRIPKFEPDKCCGCRKCVQFCQYNALAFIKGKPRLFAEICHSCGGCALICPNKAITETGRDIGIIERGESDGVSVYTGILKNGEATGVPIIRQLLKTAPSTDTIIIDCPPGSACSVMESIKNADYCILVAEPTLFGLSNLVLVARLVRLFEKPCGIVINKDSGAGDLIDAFALKQGIPVLCNIPYDEQLGALTAKGMLAAKVDKYKEIFIRLYESIREKAGGGE